MPSLDDAITLLLGATISLYWCYVGLMVLRVRRDARQIRRVLIPAQTREKLMWIVWAPLLTAWLLLPSISGWLDRHCPAPLGLPGWAIDAPVVLAIRCLGLAGAIVCLVLSIRCWRHMGRHWRMGVDPAQEGKLFVDGPFTVVRHPIYALSIGLMLCSAVVVLCTPMWLIAAVHICLMCLKARNEEQFLRGKYGAAYDEYCRQTGRFVPKPASRRAGSPSE